MRTKPVVEWTMDNLKEILERARMGPLSEEDYEVLSSVLETLQHLTHLAKDKRAAEIFRLLGASKSEKASRIAQVLNPELRNPESPNNVADGEKEPPEEKARQNPHGAKDAAQQQNTDGGRKRNGHGRNGAAEYTGARQTWVPLQSMKAGERCQCGMGNLCNMGFGPLVRIVGQAPLQAEIYNLQKLRCNTCGEVFTADPPEGVGPEKYDATSSNMVAVLKYGSGFPFHRLEGLQANLGIPLPASTQWDMVQDGAERMQPAFDELIRQAAQGEVLYNDDTSVKILEYLKHNQVQEDPDFPGRTGIFTTGIVSTREGRKIALFFSGRKHAGENIADVLAQRAASLPPPIQMCDALSRNLPRQLEVVLGNCLTHGRRNFVKAAANFPDECATILKILGAVYHNDALAREQGMTPTARLAFHQTQSGPLMEQMKQWFALQLDERRCEPNSGLGAALAYMQNRWDRLTLFLRVAGAPLDSNIVERALKKAILHRKTALFYKTQRGAKVGDLFMSLIYTCQLENVNPFEYLNALHRNAGPLSRNPDQCMPWNFHYLINADARPHVSN